MFVRHVMANLLLLWLGLQVAYAQQENRSVEDISFTRDVLPVLSDRCLSCHGPDEGTREGGLRLDRREEAVRAIDGKAAIVPGRPEASELVRRILSTDPDQQMPPPDSGRTLTPREIDLLKRWIEQGAEYETHWSFTPPERPALPDVQPVDGSPWPKQPLDHFVLAQLQQRGQKPSPPAPLTTLARRVSLDLTGLPPVPEEVETFLKDCSMNGVDPALERYVDQRLASPHYGERMAMVWLDAARYSDTDGFQADATRTNWPWRDWVIAAFHRNQPFDAFTLEQFAGDLLPNSTDEQKLATCFHRNHMTNGEGGRDPEESRVDYVIDRVNTVGTVWLGLTLGCCQCHSHKYDPVSQADYYSLSAFFNSIDEDGKAGSGAKPFLPYQSPYAAKAVEEAQREVARREAALTEVRSRLDARFPEWLAQRRLQAASGLQTWRPLRAERLETAAGTKLHQEDDGTIQAAGSFPKHEHYRVVCRVPAAAGNDSRQRWTGLKLEVLPHESQTGGGLSRSENGHVILTGLKVLLQKRGQRTVKEIAIAVATADYSPAKSGDKAYGPIADVLDDDPRTGWSTEGSDPKQPRLVLFAFQEPVEVVADDELIVELAQHSLAGYRNLGRFRLLVTEQPGPAVRSLERPPLEELAELPDDAAIPESLSKRLKEQFLADQAQLLQAQRAVDVAKQRLNEVKKEAGKLNVMVLSERREPRRTHLLQRGVWDAKGQEVAHGVPASVSAWPDDLPRDRLGLAKWLVDRRNPLTARVAVNRLWQMLWGAGLVRTPEDFGLQGERPTHPELLDWLAVEYVERGWDTKALLKQIVLSAAYRQSSNVTAELLATDPENRWLARGARFRLPAWMIRDASLSAAGLLNRTQGGPPVRPWQPEGIWEENTMGRFHYEPTPGPDQYRRTVYAFWRRSVAPTFLFDSAQRRVCEVRVARTNTPLQALTLMNDLTFLEAARGLAATVLSSGSEPSSRLTEMFRRTLSREPSEQEAALLTKQLETALHYYRQNAEAAARLLSHGQWQPDKPLDSIELAAYSLLASTILNMDETITRE